MNTGAMLAQIGPSSQQETPEIILKNDDLSLSDDMLAISSRQLLSSSDSHRLQALCNKDISPIIQ